MAVTREDVVKGRFFRLIENLGGSKAFQKGTVIKIINVESRSGGCLYKSEYESLDGKQYRGYEYLYLSNLEALTETEVKLMNKPAPVVIHTVGYNNFQKTTAALKDKQIAAILTANPTAEVAVYTLAGVATTKPVEVEFTFASDILK